jgi:glycosyltransferase involved in cell wall biosynthesis
LKALISIIVPVYNIKQYIQNCIKSLLNQTYKNIEIILVDDGSTDGSDELCNKIKNTDIRIKVIHKVNGGLSSARNAGIDIASGDYVMFVDGDDYLAENAVEILLKKNENYNADIVQFYYEETNDKYRKIYDDGAGEELYINDTKTMFELMYKIGGTAVSACTKLYKRSLFKELRFKEGILHEDEYMSTYMLQKAESILYISNKLYFYVVRQGSIINSYFSKPKMDIFFVLEDRIEELKKLNFDEFVENEKLRYCSTYMRLWCEAKNMSDTESCKIMEAKIKRFLHKYRIRIYKIKDLLYILYRINPKFVYFYYYLRKMRNNLLRRKMR